MADVQGHLRRTFLAGIFSFVPVVVTIFIVWWIDKNTRWITLSFYGQEIPVVGILITILAVYLSGLIVTSLLGKQLLSTFDGLLSKLPFVSQLYSAWKQIALTPGGTEGVFSKVCLIPDETGQMHMLGFTSGRGNDGDPDLLAVFVPQSPNPITGRLYFVKRDKCTMLTVSPEEAFKIVLSTGNYVPGAIGTALKGELKVKN